MFILVDEGWYGLTAVLNVCILKRIQTPHCWFWVLRPLQAVGQAAEYKFKSKFEPVPVIWQSLPKAIPETIKGLTAKSNAKLLELQSGMGWTGKHKHSVFQSLQQSLLAAGLLVENVIPLLLFWLESPQGFHLGCAHTVFWVPVWYTWWTVWRPWPYGGQYAASVSNT